MYVIALTFLMTWFESLVAMATQNNLGLLTFYNNQIRRAQAVLLAENVQQYLYEFGGFPASITVLSDTAGYSHVRSLTNSWQGYAVSGPIADTVWTSQRAAVFSFNPSSGTTQTGFLSANACGTGNFATATSWCGPSTSQLSSLWWRKDAREDFSVNISTQRARQNRFLQKFADYYSGNQTFPSQDQSAATLVPNTTYSITTLVSYAGSATNCSGQFNWLGLPIDCGDMFDLWGNGVGISYFSPTHIALLSVTPITNAGGANIVVSSDLSF